MFPKLVFKKDGPHRCLGGSYDFKVVNDESEQAKALKKGWHKSIPEAMEKGSAPVEREQ